jgi:trimethylamine corrinoid protein
MGIKEDLVKAIKSGDAEKSVEMTKKVLAAGISAGEIANFLTNAIREVGDKFERFEIFLPEMMMASVAMIETMKILEPQLKEEEGGEGKRSTKIVMATVKGDIHEIGKNIVITLMNASGFDVIDLGSDVDSLEIIKTAERERADLIGLSALMTTTMLGQKEVLDILKETGKRKSFKVIIGGAPTSQDWADKIGADGWSKDASNAVRLVEKLVK